MQSKKFELSLLSLTGKSIVEVERQILQADIDMEDADCLADGPTQIIFSDGQILSIYGDTESQGVIAAFEEMKIFGPSYEKIIPNSSFWKDRLGVSISDLALWYFVGNGSEGGVNFGIEFVFANGLSMIFEYVDNGFVCDSVQVVPVVELSAGVERILLKNP
ncbi:hypothetical protein [Chromobacterium sp. ATCC 53434]|uniref:hypothetical protein n=1 Tax=Chromobacterium sp. (strain ATCC 53434 / SC 14030) TaxID=2059672 RepID=UPI00130533C6|nr:hypothetical protein [Chromobacterium sp. ATCC 53434]